MAEPYYWDPLRNVLIPRPYPGGRADSEAFWARARAAVSEGFCPAPNCGARLIAEIPPPGWWGGRCPEHGAFWQDR